MVTFFLIIGLICLIHYIIIVSYAGIHAAFANFWIICSIGSFCIGGLWSIGARYNFFEKIPSLVKSLVIGLVTVGVVIFLCLLSLVSSRMNAKPDKQVDCIVVLGAKVDGTRITKSLLKRLEAARDYLKENESVKVIVSGGQGEFESVSEAQAMYDYLISQGIAEDRIIKEEKSTTTKENLVYSYELVKEQFGNDAKIAIVTSNFHIFRAELLAKKLGIKNVSGLAANADPFLIVNYMFRECAALIKEKMLGNI